jgi:hypothetical protein
MQIVLEDPPMQLIMLQLWTLDIFVQFYLSINISLFAYSNILFSKDELIQDPSNDYSYKIKVFQKKQCSSH